MSEFIDVGAKLRALGCAAPTGVTVLPYNLETAESVEALCYVGTYPGLIEHLRSNGIPGTWVERAGKAPVQIVLRESAVPQWIPPTLYVAGNLALQNPAVVDLLLGAVSNFVCDPGKHVLAPEPIESDQIAFSVVKLSARGLTYKKATFKGPWKKGRLKAFKESGKIVRNMRTLTRDRQLTAQMGRLGGWMYPRRTRTRNHAASCGWDVRCCSPRLRTHAGRDPRDRNAH